MIAWLAACAVVGQIELRAHEEAPSGVVVGVEQQGVLLAPGAGAAPSYLIGWDRVLDVGGVHAPEAEAYADDAMTAWRARTRLERGDAVSAEPMFEALFEQYAGQAGPTSVVVCEGLLRCRLRRGAHVGALESWMALLQARQQGGPAGPVWIGDTWSEEASLGPVLDESGLVPALPPIWLAWPSVTSLAAHGHDDSLTDRAGALSRMYVHAARFEAGEIGEIEIMVDQHWSVQLVQDIVIARTGDAMARRVARERLRRLIDQDVDSWVEAWCRAGIGRSLVLEASKEDRLRGVLELLHLPARFRRTQPYLCGLVLGECVVVLHEAGDEASASILARELTQGYLGHPVLDWPPLASYLATGQVAMGADSPH